MYDVMQLLIKNCVISEFYIMYKSQLQNSLSI